MTRRFPDGFLWGAATASYQIEGAVAEDGRTPSIWDTFSHTPGKVLGGDTGDVADDHYHRMPQDVEAMGALGLQAYRFSIAWPRVVPRGGDTVNPAGIAFYSRLVDELLERGIKPVATLYHWDLPQELEDAGGWPARETALRFADYAEKVGAALGDRVHTWTTLNEPWCSAYLGYGSGEHAPGRQEPVATLAASHHLNLAHGLAVAALRTVVSPEAQMSVTLNVHHVRAASDSAEDRAAADLVDRVSNRIYLDPMLGKGYPEQLRADTAHLTDWSFVQDGDEARIAAPIDVLGLNYYSPTLIRARDPQEAARLREAGRPSAWTACEPAEWVKQPGPYTAMGWSVDASGLSDLLLRVSRDYPGVPTMVTENGAAYDDAVAADGGVHDAERVTYFRDHIGAVADALDAGADVRGYLAWSLLDNFEWAFGYSKRFGLIHVDYQTQQRTWKDSAYFYRDVVAAHGLPD